jgi:hypothetical protein
MNNKWNGSQKLRRLTDNIFPLFHGAKMRALKGKLYDERQN